MRIGIFGGAFNPIHNGHIIIAVLSMETLKLDKLFIVPTYNPPHREKMNFAPYEKRVEWAQISFHGINKIETSRCEEELGGISYSYNTIKFFKEKFNTKPFFIIGEDSALSFEKWYRWKELKKMANFVVYPRFKEKKFSMILSKHPEFSILENLPLIEISATTIRERIKKNLPIRGMVHSRIEEDVQETFKKILR